MKKEFPGLTLLIDFEKAFDTIEWTFLIWSIIINGFGKVFLHWVKIIYKDISVLFSLMVLLLIWIIYFIKRCQTKLPFVTILVYYCHWALRKCYHKKYINQTNYNRVHWVKTKSVSKCYDMFLYGKKSGLELLLYLLKNLNYALL